MTESLIIAFLGGRAGLAMGYGGISLLSTIRIPSDIPFVLDLHLDLPGAVVLFAGASASCVLFGIAPAFQTTRVELVPALKSGIERNIRAA